MVRGPNGCAPLSRVWSTRRDDCSVISLRIRKSGTFTEAARTVNQTLVTTYWQMGRYLVEYEQNGADRAKYGAEILTRLSHDLTIRCGRGFGKSNLVYMRKLYRAFPKGMTASYQLTWSHYLEILKSNGELEIGFYCAECVRSNWDVRELRHELAIALEEETRRLNRAKRR